MPSADQDIRALLTTYFKHLVTSSAADIVPLYAPDGVTMAQGFPSQVGHAAIKAWYTGCFTQIALDVELTIEEIEVVSEEYAFARTSSKGTQRVLATGGTSAEANQELFVLKKVGGAWKIARYCFCTIKGPQ